MKLGDAVMQSEDPMHNALAAVALRSTCILFTVYGDPAILQYLNINALGTQLGSTLESHLLASAVRWYLTLRCNSCGQHMSLHCRPAPASAYFQKCMTRHGLRSAFQRSAVVSMFRLATCIGSPLGPSHRLIESDVQGSVISVKPRNVIQVYKFSTSLA